MRDETQKLVSALRVIVLTKETRKYLEENDPQALKQAEEALAAVKRPLTHEELVAAAWVC